MGSDKNYPRENCCGLK